MYTKCLSMMCLIIFFSSIISYGQTEIKTLTIYSITEYVDGYVIKAIDTLRSDTIRIISKRDDFSGGNNYEKVKINGSYRFKIFDVVLHLIPPSPNPYPISIKSTVVWRPGDRVKDVPVYARNMLGLYITEE